MFAALLFNQPLTLKLVTTMHKLLPVIGLFCMLLLSLHGQAQSSWADSTLNTMSLDEKIGQLIMVAAYSNKDSVYENHLEATIEKYHIGGIIFSRQPTKSGFDDKHLSTEC